MSIPWAYIGLGLFLALGVIAAAVHDMPASGLLGVGACCSLLLIDRG